MLSGHRMRNPCLSVGEFNDWDRTRNPMTRAEYIGIYTCFVPGVKEGMMYKFCIETITGELSYEGRSVCQLCRTSSGYSIKNNEY